MKRLLLLPVLFATACAATNANEPSLAPRAAEAIDPRVPVTIDAPPAPADPALVARLAALGAGVRGDIAAFDAAAPGTQRLVDAAGAPQSESWIDAQQAVSALQALRGPLANAVAEIDELASTRVEQGGINAGDLAAIDEARRDLGAINDRQAALIAAMTDRLGG